MPPGRRPVSGRRVQLRRERIAIAYADGHADVWDVANHRLLARSTAAARTASLGGVWLSADGAQLAVTNFCCDVTVVSDPLEVWSVDPSLARSHVVLRIHTRVDAAGFTPSGDVLVGLPSGPKADLVFVRQRDQMPLFRSSAPIGSDSRRPLAVGYNAEKREFVIAHGDGYVEWQPGHAAVSTSVSCSFFNGAISPDGVYFACANGPLGEVSVWNVASHRLAQRWSPSVSEPPGSLAFLDHDREIAVVLAKAGPAYVRERVGVYRITDRTMVRTYALAPTHFADAYSSASSTLLWSAGAFLVTYEYLTDVAHQGIVYRSYVLGPKGEY